MANILDDVMDDQGMNDNLKTGEGKSFVDYMVKFFKLF